MLRLSSCAFAVLLVASSSGCTAEADASDRRTFEPPYRADPEHPTVLIVRPDLAARLESAPATTTGVEAEVVGVGRLGFAPDAAYALRVPLPSYVERVRVGVGDHVAPGQIVAELRSSDIARLRAELASATIEARVERQQVERLRPLVADGTATPRELAEAMGRLERDEAELASARQALAALGAERGRGDRYVLRATSAGRVIARNVAAGERTGPEDEPAFLVGDPDRLVVRAAFPERDAAWLREGMPCTFSVHALGSERLPGTIVRLVRAVDPRTRSAVAFCEPAAQDPRFTAEMLARVQVSAAGSEHVVVPRSALLLRRDQWVVFVRLGPDRLERRVVEAGRALGGEVQIRSGVAPGDEVITRGVVLLDGELDVLL